MVHVHVSDGHCGALHVVEMTQQVPVPTVREETKHGVKQESSHFNLLVHAPSVRTIKDQIGADHGERERESAGRVCANKTSGCLCVRGSVWEFTNVNNVAKCSC